MAMWTFLPENNSISDPTGRQTWQSPRSFLELEDGKLSQTCHKLLFTVGTRYKPDDLRTSGWQGGICITRWWLGHPSEKYEFVNWDDNRNPILMGICQKWQPNHQPDHLSSNWYISGRKPATRRIPHGPLRTVIPKRNVPQILWALQRPWHI